MNRQLFTVIFDDANTTTKIETDAPTVGSKDATFVVTQPDDDERKVNPVLAGYFLKVVSLLIVHTPRELDKFLGDKTEALYEAFVKHMHCRSIAELYVRLFTNEAMTLDSSKFVEKCIPLIPKKGMEL